MEKKHSNGEYTHTISSAYVSKHISKLSTCPRSTDRICFPPYREKKKIQGHGWKSLKDPKLSGECHWVVRWYQAYCLAHSLIILSYYTTKMMLWDACVPTCVCMCMWVCVCASGCQVDCFVGVLTEVRFSPVPFYHLLYGLGDLLSDPNLKWAL